MKLKLELPHPMEMVNAVGGVESGKIEFTPRVAPSQTEIRVCYLSAGGDAGMTSAGLLTFNPRNGRFRLRHVQPAEMAPVLFDASPVEFAARQKTNKKAKAAGQPPPAAK